MALSVISLLRSDSVAFGREADMKTVPPGVHAQPGRLPIIGILGSGSPDQSQRHTAISI
jgi:hypothetical protein